LFEPVPSSDTGSAFALPEYEIPESIRPYLSLLFRTNSKEKPSIVKIDEAGDIVIRGAAIRKPGLYTCLSWSGHDGGFESSDGDFIIVKAHELHPEFHSHVSVGRQIEIKSGGEIRATVADPLRHANIMRDIAALEAVPEKELSHRWREKLKTLRVELREFEPEDPTAVTLEAKRANSSVEAARRPQPEPQEPRTVAAPAESAFVDAHRQKLEQWLKKFPTAEVLAERRANLARERQRQSLAPKRKSSYVHRLWKWLHDFPR
jgi:hypothetical protein